MLYGDDAAWISFCLIWRHCIHVQVRLAYHFMQSNAHTATKLEERFASFQPGIQDPVVQAVHFDLKDFERRLIRKAISSSRLVN